MPTFNTNKFIALHYSPPIEAQLTVYTINGTRFYVDYGSKTPDRLISQLLAQNIFPLTAGKPTMAVPLNDMKSLCLMQTSGMSAEDMERVVLGNYSCGKSRLSRNILTALNQYKSNRSRVLDYMPTDDASAHPLPLQQVINLLFVCVDLGMSIAFFNMCAFVSTITKFNTSKSTKACIRTSAHNRTYRIQRLRVKRRQRQTMTTIIFYVLT
jgi:hypothetical protein